MKFVLICNLYINNSKFYRVKHEVEVLEEMKGIIANIHRRKENGAVIEEDEEAGVGHHIIIIGAVHAVPLKRTSDYKNRNYMKFMMPK